MRKCHLHPNHDTLTAKAAFAHIECGCDDDLDWFLADSIMSGADERGISVDEEIVRLRALGRES